MVDITRHNITWTITGTPTNGTFWNGDPWVLDGGSGVEVTAISPSTTGTGSTARHGSMVNPSGSITDGGFDGRVSSGSWYDDANNDARSLPLTLNDGDSLVTGWSLHAGFVGETSFDEATLYFTGKSGDFTEGETITASSGGTATLQAVFYRDELQTSGGMILTNGSGTFAVSDTLTGGTSSETATISTSGLGSTVPYMLCYAVLTVVGADLTGTDYFRPPYVGSEKPLHRVSDCDFTKLMGFTDPPFDPRTTGAVDGYKWANKTFYHVDENLAPKWSLPYDFVGGGAIGNRQLRPLAGLHDYAGDVSSAWGSSCMVSQMSVYVHFNFDDVQDVAKWLVQYGIDLYPMTAESNDNAFYGNGGFAHGRLWPIIFAGILLNNDDYKTVAQSNLPTITDFYGDPVQPFFEQQMAYYSTTAYSGYRMPRPDSYYSNGKPLYGGQNIDGGLSGNHTERENTFQRFDAVKGNGYPRTDSEDTSHEDAGPYMTGNVVPAIVGQYIAAVWMDAKQYFYQDAFFDFMERWIDDKIMWAGGMRDFQYTTVYQDTGTVNDINITVPFEPIYDGNLVISVQPVSDNTSTTCTMTVNGVTKSLYAPTDADNNTVNLSVGGLLSGSETTFHAKYDETIDAWIRYTEIDYYSPIGNTDGTDLYAFGGTANGFMSLVYKSKFRDKQNAGAAAL